MRLDRLAAEARHAALGQVSARVVDLSVTGVALAVAGSGHRPGTGPEGGRLEGLRIHCGGCALYLGEGEVKRIERRDDGWLLGIELLSGGIDFSQLYRLRARQGFSARLAAALDPSRSVDPAGFKEWVDSQRSALEKFRDFLDTEELALADLDLHSRGQAIAALLDEAGPRLVGHMNAASEELRRRASALGEDQHPACRAYYRAELHPLLLQSPFMRRAFEKPLGYAGDYEMMNMLYRDHAEGDTLFAKALNLYATQEAAARANINRLEYLGDRIREAIGAQGRVRLASIGCGPAREIGVLLEREPGLGERLDVTLIDQEENVIAYCERTLSPLAAGTGARLRIIREPVRRMLGTRGLKEALGECDLIYSAGLFDYLERRTFAALLGSLYGALAPEGHLCVGNVGSHNPTRHAMEYLLDWFLIHRSPAELEEFALTLDPKPRRYGIDSEPTGVNLFLRIWK